MRFSCIRALAVVSLCLLSLVVLWFALPFPEISSENTRNTIATRILSSGSRLATVHDHSSTFRALDSTVADLYEPGVTGFWSGTILEWQLKQKHPNDHVNLTIGRPTNLYYPDLGAEFDLTRLVQKGPGFLLDSVYIWTPAGDQDGFSLPYFHFADATLLYHQIVNSWQLVHLRFLVDENGTLQVWKDMRGWDDFNPSDLTLIDDDDRRRGLIATFTFHTANARSTITDPDNLEVVFQDMLLPTTTYPIRQLIVSLLAPILLRTYRTISLFIRITWNISVFIFQTILLCGFAYFGVALFCWLVLGRPQAFSTWLKHFWMTKVISRKLLGNPPPRVWSSKGPLDDHEMAESENENSSNSGGARPLSSPLDFFKSRSPLDDLLVTFAATRWMAEPIWPDRPHSTVTHRSWYHRGHVDRYDSKFPK